MRTVAVLAMVLVVASLCAAKPYYEGLRKHMFEMDENNYPEPTDDKQVPLQQLVELQYPRRDEHYEHSKPTDSSDMDHLKHLMIDPTKPAKVRPEDYWPELEDPL